MDRGAWRATVHESTNNRTQLSDSTPCYKPWGLRGRSHTVTGKRREGGGPSSADANNNGASRLFDVNNNGRPDV